MSDEQLPTRAEMASAYLDGELEADDSAVVESDPDAMAVVESFARVRAALNTAQPVDDDTRSAAVTAALAEFDTRRATSADAVVTPLRSRHARRVRVLSGVAAAAVVAIVGIAAINSSNDHDDNSFSASVGSQQAAATTPQLKIAVDTASAGASGTAAPGAASAASIESAATSVPEINSKEELQAYAAGFENAAATAPAAAATTAAAAIPNVADNAQAACVTPEQTMLGPIVYKGTPALVVRDDTTGTIEAINAADCAVLETAP
ncbi:MAG TPA: hypothetical protein VFE86_15320 [Ilumatobacteraceae bacterium]|nr:hypothetical protein [Ilumatobacteraceae bacterium]